MHEIEDEEEEEGGGEHNKNQGAEVQARNMIKQTDEEREEDENEREDPVSSLPFALNQNTLEQLKKHFSSRYLYISMTPPV